MVPGSLRPIQLPKAICEAVDGLRFDGETWEEFMWRTLLSPRGYVRTFGRTEDEDE